MKHWIKKLYLVMGFDVDGNIVHEGYAEGLSHYEAIERFIMDNLEEVLVKATEWRVRECPPLEKFNSHWLPQDRGANRRIRKMRDRRNYTGTTIYQIDHDYRMNRLARAMLEFYRSALNL